MFGIFLRYTWCHCKPDYLNTDDSLVPLFYHRHSWLAYLAWRSKIPSSKDLIWEIWCTRGSVMTMDSSSVPNMVTTTLIMSYRSVYLSCNRECSPCHFFDGVIDVFDLSQTVHIKSRRPSWIHCMNQQLSLQIFSIKDGL